MQVAVIRMHSTSALEGHLSNVAPVSPQQLQDLDSSLECSYFGCYVSSRILGHYFFEFTTVTCTFNQVDNLPFMTSFVLSPSVAERSLVFMSTSTMTYKHEIHPARKPSGPFCHSVGMILRLA